MLLLVEATLVEATLVEAALILAVLAPQRSWSWSPVGHEVDQCTDEQFASVPKPTCHVGGSVANGCLQVFLCELKTLAVAVLRIFPSRPPGTAV